MVHSKPQRLLTLWLFIYTERKVTRAVERLELERQLTTIQTAVETTMTSADRLTAIDDVIELLRTNEGTPAETKQINKGLHKIIEKIIYHNNKESMDLNVFYK